MDWPGDILLVFAGCAVVAVLVRRDRARRQREDEATLVAALREFGFLDRE